MNSKFEIPTTAEWIEMLKKRLELATDGEAAARLHASKQSMSQWTNGVNQMDAGPATMLGLALGINPLFVVISCSYHKTKSEAKRKTLEILMAPIEPKTLEEVDRRNSK